MLMDRIIGAFTFKREVYAEVEKDASFTPTAWAIVAVVNIVNQIAGYLAGSAAAASIAGIAAQMAEETGQVIPAVSFSPVSIVTGTITSLLAFAVGAWVVSFVGKSLFKADATFDEVVRTMGLASVWGLLGLVSILGAFAPVLLCVASPLLLVGSILSIVASALAIKEALDLEWVQTIVTVVIAWVVIFIVTAVVGTIIGGAGAMLGM